MVQLGLDTVLSGTPAAVSKTKVLLRSVDHSSSLALSRLVDRSCFRLQYLQSEVGWYSTGSMYPWPQIKIGRDAGRASAGGHGGCEVQLLSRVLRLPSGILLIVRYSPNVWTALSQI